MAVVAFKASVVGVPLAVAVSDVCLVDADWSTTCRAFLSEYSMETLATVRSVKQCYYLVIRKPPQQTCSRNGKISQTEWPNGSLALSNINSKTVFLFSLSITTQRSSKESGLI